MVAAARPELENTTPSRGQFFSVAAPGKERTMANRSKVRTEAEAKFRKTLKATWKGKKITTPYEAEARVARNKTARLRELRLAKEATDKVTETKQVTKKKKILKMPP
jgi:hypothetical protein